MILNATSLGGVQSTIETRHRWEGDRVPEELLRLSVGLEAAEELWRDLAGALSRRSAVGNMTRKRAYRPRSVRSSGLTPAAEKKESARATSADPRSALPGHRRAAARADSGSGAAQPERSAGHPAGAGAPGGARRRHERAPPRRRPPARGRGGVQRARRAAADPEQGARPGRQGGQARGAAPRAGGRRRGGRHLGGEDRRRQRADRQPRPADDRGRARHRRRRARGSRPADPARDRRPAAPRRVPPDRHDRERDGPDGCPRSPTR